MRSDFTNAQIMKLVKKLFLKTYINCKIDVKYLSLNKMLTLVKTYNLSENFRKFNIYFIENNSYRILMSIYMLAYYNGLELKKYYSVSQKNNMFRKNDVFYKDTDIQTIYIFVYPYLSDKYVFIRLDFERLRKFNDLDCYLIDPNINEFVNDINSCIIDNNIYQFGSLQFIMNLLNSMNIDTTYIKSLIESFILIGKIYE